MRIRMWGVRGSLATPMSTAQLKDKQRALLAEATPADLAGPAAIERFLARSPHAMTFGGNTSCVEVSFPDATFILDCGTGARGLGGQLIADGRVKNHPLHMLFTHFHWDHICGFPYFPPIYIPKRRLDIWSGRSDSERLLKTQMADAHFPVKWRQAPMVADLECHQLPEDQATEIAGAQVRILPLIHPDKAYGYRIERGGRAVCYLTDTEVSKNPILLAKVYGEFVDKADVVIVDAMYGFLDYHDHINFGHSTIFNFIDFFKDADIGELVIFHHDPMASDPAVAKLGNDAKRYTDLVAEGARWKISTAFEGQEWDLPDR
jgi:phosphoribosyl 1,2-cyclic phosphodiesterase